MENRRQVTIPKPLRERLGITPRTVLDFHEESGLLIAEKVVSTDPVSKVLGCLKLSWSTDEVLAEMRDVTRLLRSTPVC